LHWEAQQVPHLLQSKAFVRRGRCTHLLAAAEKGRKMASSPSLRRPFAYEDY